MDENMSRIIPQKFVCGSYKFQLCGDALTEITYKVTRFSYKKIDTDKFYNDIMHDEMINFYLGVSIGCIIVDKKAYINIIEEPASCYMILSLSVLDIHSYYDSILNISTINNIRNDFYSANFNKYTCPVSINVDEFNINDNPFCNIFYTSINIFNVKDSNIGDIVDCVYDNIIRDISDNISTYINRSKLFNIGFSHRFIIVHGYKSIKVTGFIIPNTIEGVHILSVSNNSLVIEESDKWASVNNKDNSLSLYGIVPYIYNKDNLLYNPCSILNSEIMIINSKRYHKIDFDTLLFILDDTRNAVDTFVNSNLPQISFIPYVNINNDVVIYENINGGAKDLISNCGYVCKDKESILSEYISKNFKKSKVNFIYTNNDKAYFIIRTNSYKFNFKAIYNYIKTKIKLG